MFGQLRILKLPEAKTILCPYCGQVAALKHSTEVYCSSIDYGYLWVCVPCDAWVGTHRNSRNFAPLGRLANAELREWKRKAHKAFDPHWKESGLTRPEAYEWLRQEMGRVRAVHIGFMDVAECRQVVQICSRGSG